MLRLVQKLVQGIRWVDGLELFGRIFASILENNLLTARVFWKYQLALFRGGNREGPRTWKKLSYIIGLAVHNHPAGIFGVVLGDLCACEFIAAHYRGLNGSDGIYKKKEKRARR